jgi:hypothetical protein
MNFLFPRTHYFCNFDSFVKTCKDCPYFCEKHKSFCYQSREIFLVFAIFVFCKTRYFRNTGSSAKITKNREIRLSFSRNTKIVLYPVSRNFSRNKISSKTLIAMWRRCTHQLEVLLSLSCSSNAAKSTLEPFQCQYIYQEIKCNRFNMVILFIE